ncbi:MAG: hypothetical protein LAP40_13485 [Acidobacteriia bacterium]|nr:hypothetical protein [Terriglobia bacterium]
MNENPHGRARDLIGRERVDGISTADHEWLNGHLETCPECVRLAEATDHALQSLRALSVAIPPALANRTQLRVYLRAQDLQKRRRGGWMVWAACGVSWAAGIASAPYVWRAFEWMGHLSGLPSLVWKMGFALWWAAPALLAAGALLIDRSDGERYRTR